jgi:hypothetical protein
MVSSSVEKTITVTHYLTIYETAKPHMVYSSFEKTITVAHYFIIYVQHSHAWSLPLLENPKHSQ